MKHVIEVFDSKTEELVTTVQIPTARQADLVELMGWEDLEDEIYVYNLTLEQLSKIGEWTGTHFSETNSIVQLVCIA